MLFLQVFRSLLRNARLCTEQKQTSAFLFHFRNQISGKFDTSNLFRQRLFQNLCSMDNADAVGKNQRCRIEQLFELRIAACHIYNLRVRRDDIALLALPNRLHCPLDCFLLGDGIEFDAKDGNLIHSFTLLL